MGFIGFGLVMVMLGFLIGLTGHGAVHNVAVVLEILLIVIGLIRGFKLLVPKPPKNFSDHE